MNALNSQNVPERVGVLGGGRMGSGIAHAFLISGAHVVVVEVDDAAAQAARNRIEKDLGASIDRGKIEGAVQELSLIHI